MINIGFIGTGHMGKSLIIPISKNKNFKLYITNRTINKASDIADNIDNCYVSNINEIKEKCNIIFIGVKPIDMDNVLNDLSNLNENVIVISMAAGIKIEEINKKINNKIIRIMPNTPVLVNNGITLYTYNKKINKDDISLFSKIMENTGIIKEVNENDINKISVITGSGPAYINIFINSLILGLTNLGINKDDATNYVLMTLKGTLELDMFTKEDPYIEALKVCSPGGSTIEGVNVLNDNNINKIIEDAIKATFNKNNKII